MDHNKRGYEIYDAVQTLPVLAKALHPILERCRCQRYKQQEGCCADNDVILIPDITPYSSQIEPVVNDKKGCHMQHRIKKTIVAERFTPKQKFLPSQNRCNRGAGKREYKECQRVEPGSLLDGLD